MAKKNEGLQAEIVVVGGGGAGLAAALTAAEKGCRRIVVLEKAGAPAGSTSMAHDIFGAESPVQKRAGVDARKDDLFKIGMEWTHWNKVNPRLVRAFIDKSGDTIGWLEEKGLEFAIAQFFPGQVPWVRHYIVNGQGAMLMKVMRKNCADLGITIHTNACGKKIVRDADGRITGVTASTKTGELTVEAGAVIVTTGGYGNNKKMLKAHCQYYRDTMTYDGVPSNTGDGVEMAVEIGAATSGLGTLILHGPFLNRTEVKAVKLDAKDHDGKNIQVRLQELAWEPYTIWMNKHGRRFMDEAHSLAFFASGNAVAQQPDGMAYSLFDSNTVRMMEKEGLVRSGIFGIAAHTLHGFVPPAVPLPGLQRELHKRSDPNFMMISDSWKEIAEWMGAKPEVLKNSIDEYNSACDKSHDNLFVKDAKYLRPIRTAPYCAIKGHASICDAIGGIKINENMEVLDTKDSPIPGLYAAGSTTGCWESESYCYRLTGHLLGFALNSGRIAGENAVAYLSKQRSN
jgi:succinate dehydrogenase/fumarate reductase flavoprotein subunit